MRGILLILACVVAATAGGELRHKWNPAYTCTGTDTAYVTVKIMRSGVQTYYARDTVVPPIGSMVCVKYDFQQKADEKIPEVCERIGAKAAAIEGYYMVIDTTAYTDGLGKELSRETKRVWQRDEKRKSALIFEAVEKTNAELEPIGEIK